MGGVWVLLLLALAQAQYDWIVVLGAAQYGGRPSPALERRLLTALELYRKGVAPRIAVTGGKAPGDRLSEGEVGCRYLRARGVPEEALLCEGKSQNTFENLLFLKGRVQGRLLLVTDAPHLPRALFLARLLGLKAQGHPVPGRYPLGYWAREALYRLWLYLGLKPLPRSIAFPGIPGTLARAL
ncbi:MAG: YdcF family protein [Thermus sp.]|uniref:YdcF family protein n=1 Tax=Thermus sp. TaxID=275 RepID=UPI0030AAC8B0